MLTRLRGGRIIDPLHHRDETGDLWIEGERLVPPPPDRAPDRDIDCEGLIVLAGAIDIHAHIAGANVNTARLLLPELHDGTMFAAVPPTRLVGELFAAMGYTMVVEPAVSPHQALAAQHELAAIPFIDKAILCVLGNDDFAHRLIRAGEEAALADYVARTLGAGGALGVKTINPGGALAFREGAERFSLDDEVPRTGLSGRAILKAMQRAVERLGLPHPLHLHCNNLGLPGNVETALATIEAAEGMRLHLAHLQFYAYGTEGPRGFSSAAPRLAEALNRHPNVTADVGQVMFGQTVTISSDVLRQFGARGQAFPRKWSLTEAEGNGGGIVPYRYRPKNFFNAVQWAAGLELFLLVEDPSRLFFTTDHPNGAPFTAYPDLFALLMDRSLRARWLEELPAEVRAVSVLAGLEREYTWREIALMTRAAPARLLGLADRGHLAPGARADIACYRPQADKAEMFRRAEYVFKDGVLIMERGAPRCRHQGRLIAVAPPFDRAIERRLAAYYDEVFGAPLTAFDVPAAALGEGMREVLPWP